MAPVSLGRVTTEEARGFSPGSLMRVRLAISEAWRLNVCTSQKRTITRYLSVDCEVRGYLRTSPRHFKRLPRRVVILARIMHSCGTGSGEPLAALSGLRELRASQGELWAAKHSPPNQVELPRSPIFETQAVSAAEWGRGKHASMRERGGSATTSRWGLWRIPSFFATNLAGPVPMSLAWAVFHQLVLRHPNFLEQGQDSEDLRSNHLTYFPGQLRVCSWQREVIISNSLPVSSILTSIGHIWQFNRCSSAGKQTRD